MFGMSIVEYSCGCMLIDIVEQYFEWMYLCFRCVSIECIKCSGVVEFRIKKFLQFDLLW